MEIYLEAKERFSIWIKEMVFEEYNERRSKSAGAIYCFREGKVV